MKRLLYLWILFLSFACSSSDDDVTIAATESKIRPTRILISDFMSGAGVYKTIEYTYNNRNLPVLVTIYNATFINGTYTNTDLYASLNLRYELETNNLEQISLDFPTLDFLPKELNFIYNFDSDRINRIEYPKITFNSSGVLINFFQDYNWNEGDMRYNYVYDPSDGLLFFEFDDDFNLINRRVGDGTGSGFEQSYSYTNSAPILFHDLDNSKNLNEMFSLIDSIYFNSSILKYLGFSHPVNLHDALNSKETTQFNDRGFVTKYFETPSLSYEVEYETFE